MGKPLSVCPTCKALVLGRCAGCARARQAWYDKGRGSRHERGYDAEWYRWRAWAIQRYDLVLCGDRPPGAPQTQDSLCVQQGVVQVGDDLDHIRPISGPRDTLRLDSANVQLLCDREPNYCHSRKRGREAHGR